MNVNDALFGDPTQRRVTCENWAAVKQKLKVVVAVWYWCKNPSHWPLLVKKVPNISRGSDVV